MRIELDAGMVLRSWEVRDVDALARHANDREVWLNLRDRFPHPYTREDARRWIALCADEPLHSTHLAIEVDGSAVGAVGFDRLQDVHRLTAEIGYWLGRAVWGRRRASMSCPEKCCSTACVISSPTRTTGPRSAAIPALP